MVLFAYGSLSMLLSTNNNMKFIQITGLLCDSPAITLVIIIYIKATRVLTIELNPLSTATLLSINAVKIVSINDMAVCTNKF